MPVKVLFCASEAVPYAKTGGLADVVGALPAVLRALGHDVRLVMPRYRSVALEGLSPIHPLRIGAGGTVLEGAVLGGVSPAGVPVYFVDCPPAFAREGLYGERGADYPDNLLRFAFFSQAAIAIAEHVFRPDLIHCHDWHAALIPVYLHWRERLRRPSWPTLLTVHNIAMQGVFPREQLAALSLPAEYFGADRLEFWGRVNSLKGGLIFSDLINTVSERYAQEIQTPEFGAGLEGVLQARRESLFGVLNGVDYSEWDPRHDRHLPARYGPDDLEGKRLCKRSLQEEHRIDVKPYAPLIGMVGRLTDQKGCDLIAAVMPALLAQGVQFVLLGTGDLRYHTLFTELAQRHPHQVGITLGFDEALAHRIEGGADMFLMPSRFEPSGLNQLYSMRYGTVPIVRRTGGLADSVTDADPRAVAAGIATGFVFDAYTPDVLYDATQRALQAFGDPMVWARIQDRGMRADFSWNRSAARYVALYEMAARRVAQPV